MIYIVLSQYLQIIHIIYKSHIYSFPHPMTNKKENICDGGSTGRPVLYTETKIMAQGKNSNKKKKYLNHDNSDCKVFSLFALSILK